MALTDNLVSYWKLDESSGNAADSVGSNTLTNNNTTAYAAGKINNGADFELSFSNSLSITDAAQTGLDLTGAFTISFWVKPESVVSGYHTMVSKGGISVAASDTTTQYLIWRDNDGAGSAERVQFLVRTAGANKEIGYTTGSAILNAGTWYHIVAYYNPSTKMELFINNVSVASSTSSVPASLVNTARPFGLGADEAATAANFFDGVIDEVGIWNRVLTSDEITSLYNSGNGWQYPFTPFVNSNFFFLF